MLFYERFQENLKASAVRALAAVLCMGLVLGITPGLAYAFSPKDPSYNSSELSLLARVVYAEAAGEPYVGKVAVAAVILNRVRSPLFPDTVAGVVYEAWQFSCVGNSMFNSTPSWDSVRAAQDALAGWDPTGGALFYFNHHLVSNSWLWSKPFAAVIGNHRFTY